MTDDEFLRAFLQGWPSGERFSHREHLRMAWLVIERHGPELAAEIPAMGCVRWRRGRASPSCTTKR